jgi:DNA invertase Pin-like site-specific DNA recombinase
MKHTEVRNRVARFIKDHPGLSYQKIADLLHCSRPTITLIAREYTIKRCKTLSFPDLDLIEESLRHA